MTRFYASVFLSFLFFSLLISNFILLAGPGLSDVNCDVLIGNELMSINASNKASK